MKHLGHGAGMDEILSLAKRLAAIGWHLQIHLESTLIAHGRTLAIATGAGALLPLEVQPESRRAVAWDDYLRGTRLTAGRALAS